MTTRMNQDLCFAHDQATRDFEYEPRPFNESSLEFSTKN